MISNIMLHREVLYTMRGVHYEKKITDNNIMFSNFYFNDSLWKCEHIRATRSNGNRADNRDRNNRRDTE